MAAVIKLGELDTKLGVNLEREAWKAGHDAGMKRGAASFFQSTVMENLSVEIKLLKVLNAALMEGLRMAERDRDFWHAKFKDCVRVIGKPR